MGMVWMAWCYTAEHCRTRYLRFIMYTVVYYDLLVIRHRTSPELDWRSETVIIVVPNETDLSKCIFMVVPKVDSIWDFCSVGGTLYLVFPH